MARKRTGVIMSPSTEIESIQWSNARGKVKVEAAFIHNDGHRNWFFLRLADGTFVTNHDLSRAAYMVGRWPWTDAVLKGLVGIGAISKAAFNKHMKDATARDERSSLSHKAANIYRACDRAGMAMSDEQLAFVKQHAPKVLETKDA